MTRDDILKAAKTAGLNYVLFVEGTPESAFASKGAGEDRLQEMDPMCEDGDLELYHFTGECVMTNGLPEQED